MEIIFKKGKQFKKLIDNCKNLLSIGNLKFNENGIFLNTIDVNQTAVIYFHIPTDAFSTFNIQEEMILSIDFKYLSGSVFKTYKDTDELKIKYKNNSDKVKFIFKNTTTKKTATHTLNLLNNENDEIELPDIECDTEININPETIDSITKDCAIFGNNLKIKTIESNPNNKIEFSVEDMGSKAEYQYEENEEDIEEIIINNPVELSFRMEYISKFAKFSGMATSLTIYLTNDQPLLYKYNTRIGEVKLYLSPNISD